MRLQPVCVPLHAAPPGGRGYLEVFAWHELTAKQQHAIRLESGSKAVMCVVWGITRKGVKAARDLTRQGVAA